MRAFVYVFLFAIFEATKMAASGPQRNRNVNKRTHCIVVDQDSLNIFVVYRLYGQRGSISDSETAQARKRKRSVKFSTTSEDSENNGAFLEQNGGAVSTERGEQYIALTEITTHGSLQGDGEGSPVTQGDTEGTSGSEDVNVEVDAGGSQPESDVANDENQGRNEEVKYELSNSLACTCRHHTLAFQAERRGFNPWSDLYSRSSNN
jgi:hypothetical protein